MSLRLSANAAPSTWRDAKDLIIKRIENSWINYGSEDRDRIFITTTSLKGIWRDPAELDSDPFSYLSPILATSFDQFCRTSICLVSALVHYGWDPNFATDRLEVGGLWIDSLQRLLTDNDIPLNTPDFETIFGGRKVAFIDGQLMFKPGVLEDNHHGFCRLQPGTRLPFRYLQNENPRSGFYGEVTKVEVLRGYFRLPDSRRQNKVRVALAENGNLKADVSRSLLAKRSRTHVAISCTKLNTLCFLTEMQLRIITLSRISYQSKSSAEPSMFYFRGLGLTSETFSNEVLILTLAG